jgi:hypothetical protein
MKNFSVRPAEPKDAAPYAAWLRAAAAINLVDAGVYSYPTCNTLVVEKDEAPVLINSFQAAIVMEALAPKPGLSPMDEARALKVLFDGVTRVAQASGVREVLFGCSDVRVENFVTRHGWEKLNFPMFRAKIEANQ